MKQNCFLICFITIFSLCWSYIYILFVSADASSIWTKSYHRYGRNFGSTKVPKEGRRCETRDSKRLQHDWNCPHIGGEADREEWTREACGVETASDHLALLCSGVCHSGRGIHGQVSAFYSFTKECGVVQRVLVSFHMLWLFYIFSLFLNSCLTVWLLLYAWNISLFHQYFNSCQTELIVMCGFKLYAVQVFFLL